MGNGAVVMEPLASEVEHVPHQLHREEGQIVMDHLQRVLGVLQLLHVKVNKFRKIQIFTINIYTVLYLMYSILTLSTPIPNQSTTTDEAKTTEATSSATTKTTTTTKSSTPTVPTFTTTCKVVFK